MSLIPPRLHGILDYATVVFFLLAPTLFSNTLFGGTITLCYVLAVVHLTMTLLTDFPLGMAEVISLGVHGVVELIVSIALVVLPWILAPAFQKGLTGGQGAQWFYTISGSSFSPCGCSRTTARRVPRRRRARSRRLSRRQPARGRARLKRGSARLKTGSAPVPRRPRCARSENVPRSSPRR
jgi:hypothetical protein